MYDVYKAIKAQKQYCEENGFPHFAPNDGICWNCNKNIYLPIEQKRILYLKGKEIEQIYTTGITVEKAGDELVTGCPHCHRSYCD